MLTEFNFFSNLRNLTNSEIKNAADDLRKAYSEDLESYIYDELVQFSYLLNEKCSGINESKYSRVDQVKLVEDSL